MSSLHRPIRLAFLGSLLALAVLGCSREHVPAKRHEPAKPPPEETSQPNCPNGAVAPGEDVAPMVPMQVKGGVILVSEPMSFERKDWWSMGKKSSEGVLFVEEQPLALDLTGLDPESAAGRIARYPLAAVSLTGTFQVLCSDEVLRAVESTDHVAQLLTFLDGPDDRGVTLNRCLNAYRGKQVYLGGETWASHLENLACNRQLVGITLGDRVKARHLRYLGAMHQLRYLSIPELGHIYDVESYDVLAGLKQLTVLDVSCLGDDTLRYMSGMTELRQIRARTCSWEITDAGIANLRDLKHLRELYVIPREGAISGAGFAVLKGLTGLRRLTLEVDADESTFQILSGFSELRELVLVEEVSGKDLAYLGKLEKLEHLELWRTDFTDEDLASLKHLTRLKTLHMGGGRRHRTQPLVSEYTVVSTVGSFGLAEGAELGAEEEIDKILQKTEAGRVSPVDQSAPTVAKVAQDRPGEAKGPSSPSFPVPRLQEGLSNLVALTRLETLRLSNMGVGDAGLRYIGKLSILRDLDLSHCPVTGTGLHHLVGLGALERLVLKDTQVDDKGMAFLAQLSQLEELNLLRCDITGDALKPLEQLARLRVLSATPGKGVEEAVQRLRKANPGLKWIADDTPRYL